MVIEPGRQSWVALVSRDPQMMLMVTLAQTWSVAGWTGASWMFPFHHNTVAPMNPWASGVHTTHWVHPSVSGASPQQSSVGHIPRQRRPSRCCQVEPLVGKAGTPLHTGGHQGNHSSQLRSLDWLGNNETGWNDRKIYQQGSTRVCWIEISNRKPNCATVYSFIWCRETTFSHEFIFDPTEGQTHQLKMKIMPT